MKLCGYLLLFACVWAFSYAMPQMLSRKYENTQVLEPGNYTLMWDVKLDNTGDNGNISLAVLVKTKGWAGLGISLNGSMIHSDIGMGWLGTDGTPVFYDRYALNHTVPDYKEEQNWFCQSVKRSGDMLAMEFWRLLKTGDKDRDNDIIQGFPATVVFAWHDEIPASVDTPMYHGKFRGSASVNLVPSFKHH